MKKKLNLYCGLELLTNVERKAKIYDITSNNPIEYFDADEIDEVVSKFPLNEYTKENFYNAVNFIISYLVVNRVPGFCVNFQMEEETKKDKVKKMTMKEIEDMVGCKVVIENEEDD